jgi:hypothetical protein
MQAIGRRNGNLPTMLSVMTSVEAAMDMNDKEGVSQLSDGFCVHQETMLALFPMLFLSTHQMPRMTLNHTTLGLLALGDSIGPESTVASIRKRT